MRAQSTINAHQRDGSPAVVRIRTIGSWHDRYNMTDVDIRCGHVGYRDPKGAELVHATILNTI